MRSARNRLLEDGRVLGRALHPDLQSAYSAVSQRAAIEAGRRRGPHLARVLAVTAFAAVAALAASAIGSRPGSPSPSGLPNVALAEAAATDVQGSLEVHGAGVVSMALAAEPVTSPRLAAGTRDCAEGSLSLELALDRDVYVAGSVVRVDLVLRNNGAQACRITVDPCRSGISVTGTDGGLVYASGADPTWRCAGAASTVLLARGGIATLGFDWGRKPCEMTSTCGQADVRPGRYRVDAEWATVDSPLVARPRHLVIADRVS